MKVKRKVWLDEVNLIIAGKGKRNLKPERILNSGKDLG